MSIKLPTLLVPENFLNIVFRNIVPDDGNIEDVPIAVMIKHWYSSQYPDLTVAQINSVVNWYISSVSSKGTDFYRESKFDSHVLTETFRLREENIKLKKEILDTMSDNI